MAPGTATPHHGSDDHSGQGAGHQAADQQAVQHTLTAVAQQGAGAGHLVDARTRTQGADHSETLRARHGLGVNLGRLGRWEEALAESRNVWSIRARVLGPDHPDTLVSRREIAVGLGRLSRWDEALEIYQEVARARERVLGAEHPDALTSRNDEAHCLEQLGRSAEAVELYRHVAALRQQRSARESRRS